MWGRGWPWLALVLTPLLAHAPELLGLVSTNPLYLVSALGHLHRPPLIGGLPWIDPNTGYTTQALGAFSARQLLHGHIAWWNPYIGVGLPGAAELQSAALFFPFVLLLAAFNGVLALKIVLQILSGAATYALLRQLGLTRGVSLTGAILFELNGTFVWLSDEPIMPIAFLPVILLGIERARAASLTRASGGWAWLAVGIAYGVYAGFPETTIIYLILAVAWAAWRLLRAPAISRRALAIALISGGVCGILLAIPLILPFLQYLRQAYIGPHDGPLPGLVATSPASILFPTMFGPPDYDTTWVQWGTAGGFIGLPLAAIANLALCRRGRDYGLRLLLAAWCAIALAKSANVPIIAQVVDVIPFMHQTWFARYAVPSWEMAAIILACFALDDWRAGLRVSLPALAAVCAIWVGAAGWSIALAAPALSHLWQDHAAFSLFFETSLAATAILFAAVAAILARRCTKSAAAVLFGLLGVQALAIALLPLGAGARGASYDKAAVKFLQGHLGLSRFYTLEPLAPNYAAFFAIASINHDMLPVSRLWVDYVRAHLDPAISDFLFTGWTPAGAVGGETRADALRHRLPAYAAIGVKYVLVPPGASAFAPPDQARRVFSGGTADIYELANPAAYFEARGGPCVLAPASRQSVRASCRGPAQLLRRELFYSGWHARAHGADLPIEQADGLFQAIPLPAGETTVTYKYAPPDIAYAYACFGVGLLWLATLTDKSFLVLFFKNRCLPSH